MRESWGEMFQKLADYKREFGTCRVPVREGKLGGWVDRQRASYRRNGLTMEQVDQLNSIGFDWQLRKQKKTKKPVTTQADDESFDAMLERLKNFKKVHGHCRVPQRYEEDPPLGWWVKNRRKEKRQGVLSQEKETKLSEIGFAWTIASSTLTEITASDGRGAAEAERLKQGGNDG